ATAGNPSLEVAWLWISEESTIGGLRRLVGYRRVVFDRAAERVHIGWGGGLVAASPEHGRLSPRRGYRSRARALDRRRHCGKRHDARRTIDPRSPSLRRAGG